MKSEPCSLATASRPDPRMWPIMAHWPLSKKTTPHSWVENNLHYKLTLYSKGVLCAFTEMPTVAFLPPDTDTFTEFPALQQRWGSYKSERLGVLSVEEFRFFFILFCPSLTKSCLRGQNSQMLSHPSPPLKVEEAEDDEGDTPVDVTTMMALESKSWSLPSHLQCCLPPHDFPILEQPMKEWSPFPVPAWQPSSLAAHFSMNSFLPHISPGSPSYDLTQEAAFVH